jgi:purine-binding chemotaxis protein CheW
MDILAARKKAAEQANARNKPEPRPGVAAQPVQEPEAPAAQPKQEPVTPPASAASPPAGIDKSPAAAGGAPMIEAARDKAGIVPVSSTGEPEATPQGEIELLSFRLGGEGYAVLVVDVREVLKFYQLTIVPNTPDYILGVMSLRGTMLPVIDLCRRFGLAPSVKNEKSRIVVASSADEEAGLLVDQVTGVFRIHPDEIKPVPENIEQGAEFLSGIVRTADRLYILLDLEKALGV